MLSLADRNIKGPRFEATVDDTKLRKFWNRLQASAKRAGQAIKSGFRAGAVALAAFTAGAAAAISAYSKQEQAELALAAALRNTGQDVDSNLAKLKAHAAELQRNSVIGDEATLAIAALGVQTGISAEEIPQFTQATADMAASIAIATGRQINMGRTGKLLAAALADPTAALSTLKTQGVVFTEAQKDMVKEMVAAGDAAGAQAIIMERVGATFAGAAAQTAQGTGVFTQARNVFGDLVEVIGKYLSPLLAPLARGFINAAGGIENTIKRIAFNIVTLRLRTERGMLRLKLPFIDFVAFLQRDVVAKITRVLANLFDKLAGIPLIGDKFKGVSDALKKTTVDMERAAKRATNSIRNDIKDLDKEIRSAGETFLREAEVDESDLAGAPTSAVNTGDDGEAARQAAAKAEADRKAAEERRKADEQRATQERIRQIGLRGEALKRELAGMEKAELGYANRQATITEERYQAGLVLDEEERARLLENNELKQEALDAEIETTRAKRVAAKEELDASLAELQLTADATAEEELVIRGERIAAIEKALNDASITDKRRAELEKRKDIEKTKVKDIADAQEAARLKKEIQLQTLADYQEVSGNLLKLAKEAGIENSLFAKAAAITNIIANTAAGVIRSQADLPAPLSWINSAAITSLGAIQLSKVKGLEAGGVIPAGMANLSGAGLGNDRVGFRLAEGEAVIPKGTVGQLQEFLDGEEQGKTISVQLQIDMDGDTIARKVESIRQRRGIT